MMLKCTEVRQIESNDAWLIILIVVGELAMRCPRELPAMCESS